MKKNIQKAFFGSLSVGRPGAWKNKKKGFLLIEAMFATTVMVFGIVAIIPLVTFSLKEATASRDQVIAGMLAQEGAELVQNLRDNNLVKSKDAFQDNFPSSDKDNCRVDYKSTDTKDCDAASMALRLNSEKYYEYGSGDETKFQRKIKLDFITAEKLEVISVVVWGGSFPGSITDNTCNTLSRCAFTKTILVPWNK
jgi:Tfp pilus assembly protein PilV